MPVTRHERGEELLVTVMAQVRAVLRALRPADPEFRAAMARRWAELPETARTPGQVLGRHGVGCEGTHGVFPRCNLACTPCYHSRDANQVRVDGPHTLGPGGRPRLRRVSFSAHFDSLMFGRRGIPRPPEEASLNPYRERFAAMFARLRREHGVRCFLAHNMTVTPANLGQVAAVVRDCRAMGYGMFSFQ